MPFKNTQKKVYAKPVMANKGSAHTKPIPKFLGKGTRARLNTAAEKHIFNSKLSS